MTVDMAISGPSHMDFEKLSPVWVQLDKLIDSALPFLKEQIRESGQFFPYAVALTQEGKIENVLGLTHRGWWNDNLEEILKCLESGIKRGTLEGRYKAVASMRSTLVRDPIETTAIRVQFEHESAVALEVFYPYDRTAVGDVKISKPILKRFWHKKKGRNGVL